MPCGILRGSSGRLPSTVHDLRVYSWTLSPGISRQSMPTHQAAALIFASILAARLTLNEDHGCSQRGAQKENELIQVSICVRGNSSSALGHLNDVVRTCIQHPSICCHYWWCWRDNATAVSLTRSNASRCGGMHAKYTRLTAWSRSAFDGVINQSHFLGSFKSSTMSKSSHSHHDNASTFIGPQFDQDCSFCCSTCWGPWVARVRARVRWRVD